MLTSLLALFPYLAKFTGNKFVENRIPEIVKDVIGTSEVPTDLTEDQKTQLQQKFQALIAQAEVAKAVQETMRAEATSEHWLVYAWRPLAILGCGFLLFLMIAFTISFGAYFMINDGAVYDRFLAFYSLVMNEIIRDQIHIFGMLAGGMAILRSTEKITGVKDFSFITKLFSKKK